MLTVLTSCE